jgi:hypothetical protein
MIAMRRRPVLLPQCQAVDDNPTYVPLKISIKVLPPPRSRRISQGTKIPVMAPNMLAHEVRAAARYRQDESGPVVQSVATVHELVDGSDSQTGHEQYGQDWKPVDFLQARCGSFQLHQYGSCGNYKKDEKRVDQDLPKSGMLTWAERDQVMRSLPVPLNPTIQDEAEAEKQ